MLTVLQTSAVEAIKKWFTGSEQTFVLAGYAGTGKTFMINQTIKELGIDQYQVVFATFTGKASLVLRRKLDKGYASMTLHKLLYKPVNEYGKITFIRKDSSDLAHLKLIVVDECSMVNKELLNDLMRIGIKILFVGDHGQLPPVGAVSDIYKRLSENPDFVLTEIHRQAEDNPIIHLSMLAREKRKIELGKYGDSVLVVSKGQLDGIWNSVMNADQVICGYNKTRKILNDRMRKVLGFTSEAPQVNDKLICLKNNWNKSIPGSPLVNGLIGNITTITKGKVKGDHRESYEFSLKPDFSEDCFNELKALTSCFHGKPQKEFQTDYMVYDQFDFGYAITCHKSQGSEWDKVFLYNEVLNSEDHHRWLYTGITRASQKLILAL